MTLSVKENKYTNNLAWSLQQSTKEFNVRIIYTSLKKGAAAVLQLSVTLHPLLVWVYLQMSGQKFIEIHNSVWCTAESKSDQHHSSSSPLRGLQDVTVSAALCVCVCVFRAWIWCRHANIIKHMTLLIKVSCWNWRSQRITGSHLFFFLGCCMGQRWGRSVHQGIHPDSTRPSSRGASPWCQPKTRRPCEFLIRKHCTHRF